MIEARKANEMTLIFSLFQNVNQGHFLLKYNLRKLHRPSWWRKCYALFHGNGFGKVSGLIDIPASHHRNVVRQ